MGAARKHLILGRAALAFVDEQHSQLGLLLVVRGGSEWRLGRDAPFHTNPGVAALLRLVHRRRQPQLGCRFPRQLQRVVGDACPWEARD
jgi:hypothetical protein